MMIFQIWNLENFRNLLIIFEMELLGKFYCFLDVNNENLIILKIENFWNFSNWKFSEFFELEIFEFF